MASLILLVCVVAPIVAGSIFLMAHGLELPRRPHGPLVIPIAPPVRALAPAAPVVAKRAPSREFAVEPTVVVNAELAKVEPSAVHRPASAPSVPRVASAVIAAPRPAPVTPAPVTPAPSPAPRVAAVAAAPRPVAPVTEPPASKRPEFPTIETLVQLPSSSARRLAPPPVPRSRFPRGSESPPIATRALPRAFEAEISTMVSDPPAMFDDHTDVDEHSDSELPPWQRVKSRRFATAS